MVNAIGKTVGGTLLVAATAAVWMWPKAKAPTAAPEPVRPIRSTLVKDAEKMPDLKFSGIVKAGADRTLMFKHSGRIERIPVIKGQYVRRGDKLAWLLPDDFRNQLDAAKAALEHDKLTFERMSNAVKKNAVSHEEVSKAEVNLKQSKAKFEVAQRTLDESVLYAPFDAMVADVPASELDMASADKPIVVLLDLSIIKIDAAVPEIVVIQQPRLQCNGDGKVYVTFDSCPDTNYPVKFIEYKATADAQRQTFTATYSLAAPKDLALLPGMSATVTVPGTAYQPVTSVIKGVEVPESAVGVDVDGSSFVWVLTPSKSDNGVFVAHKRQLGKCERVADIVRVQTGLTAGERVATAGVMTLCEGSEVTLMIEKGAAR